MDSGIQTMGDLAVTQAAPKLSKLGAGNVDKTSKDFEGMFMSQMMQPMFEGMQVDPVFGGGHAEQIMRSFLVQEYGKLAASSGKFGIAASVKSEMIKAQAAATTGGPNAIAH